MAIKKQVYYDNRQCKQKNRGFIQTNYPDQQQNETFQAGHETSKKYVESMAEEQFLKEFSFCQYIFRTNM